jgi:hypothetical protein
MPRSDHPFPNNGAGRHTKACLGAPSSKTSLSAQIGLGVRTPSKSIAGSLAEARALPLPVDPEGHPSTEGAMTQEGPTVVIVLTTPIVPTAETATNIAHDNRNVATARG